MDDASRQKLITTLGIVAGVLALVLGIARFANFVSRNSGNKDEPIRELPMFWGRWETPGQSIVITKDFDRKLEGQRILWVYEREVEGKIEKGVATSIESMYRNEAPTGTSGGVNMAVLDNDQVTRRYKLRYRVHNDKLQLWNEAGGRDGVRPQEITLALNHFRVSARRFNSRTRSRSVAPSAFSSK